MMKRMMVVVMMMMKRRRLPKWNLMMLKFKRTSVWRRRGGWRRGSIHNMMMATPHTLMTWRRRCRNKLRSEVKVESVTVSLLVEESKNKYNIIFFDPVMQTCMHFFVSVKQKRIFCKMPQCFYFIFYIFCIQWKSVVSSDVFYLLDFHCMSKNILQNIFCAPRRKAIQIM